MSIKSMSAAERLPPIPSQPPLPKPSVLFFRFPSIKEPSQVSVLIMLIMILRVHHYALLILLSTPT
ncbi:uncharacterized protein LY89DRAFT_689299 [Mollisia scopiformis]|uniref:Uncharacterized protein n=1 Tax=Mollisia scopiformis TaxID=149040 RepID=A0A194WSH8_MOLSC|nr:uncharacterized protein LY89DRAFT_689299 [Mollisia scopiformis]KUJ10639.1 hypothetical protein LY89DRAFT_689299 [Mollisia scopiformis]